MTDKRCEICGKTTQTNEIFCPTNSWSRELTYLQICGPCAAEIVSESICREPEIVAGVMHDLLRDRVRREHRFG